MNISEKMALLNTIITKLEKEDIMLEEARELYNQGIKITKELEEELERSEILISDTGK